MIFSAKKKGKRETGEKGKVGSRGETKVSISLTKQTEINCAAEILAPKKETRRASPPDQTTLHLTPSRVRVYRVFRILKMGKIKNGKSQ